MSHEIPAKPANPRHARATPCPFCGSTALVGVVGDGMRAYVHCQRCGADGPPAVEEQAPEGATDEQRTFMAVEAAVVLWSYRSGGDDEPRPRMH